MYIIAQEMAEAELAASGAGKAKGKAKDGKGPKKVPAKAPTKELPGKAQDKKPAPEKKRKDLTACPTTCKHSCTVLDCIQIDLLKSSLRGPPWQTKSYTSVMTLQGLGCGGRGFVSVGCRRAGHWRA